jgi:hypothetical protein
LSYDAKRVFAADFSGRVLVWSAEDGKKAGELDPNPPAPAQKVAAAQKAATKQKSAAKSAKGGQSAAAASSN